MLHEHLRAQRVPRYLLQERYGDAAACAVALLLDGERPPSEAERAVLDALAGDDPLAARLADGAADATVREALAALTVAYRDGQQDRVGGLAGRYGEGPHLRKARERLAAGDLLSVGALADLKSKASTDAEAREHQAAQRDAYQQRRAGEARRLARVRGLSARLRHGVEPFLEEADRLWLRVCSDSEEIAYPDPDEQPDRDGQPRDGRCCPFCKTRALAPWTPAAGGGSSEGLLEPDADLRPRRRGLDTGGPDAYPMRRRATAGRTARAGSRTPA